MAEMMQTKFLTDTLMIVLEETFEQVTGIYLDRGTSLAETLADVTAEEASRPISSRCASLAAQVRHVCYYLDVLAEYTQGRKPSDVDWTISWTQTTATAQEWDALREDLRSAYARTRALFARIADWDDDAVGGAVAMVVHTAYHLGEIRQAIGVLRG